LHCGAGAGPYQRIEFLLSSSELFTTDSEEKDHGNTRQEVSREVRRQEGKQARRNEGQRQEKISGKTASKTAGKTGRGETRSAQGCAKKRAEESDATRSKAPRGEEDQGQERETSERFDSLGQRHEHKQQRR
jgi:hypothetical protein